ncbi:MAG: two-CW domain-containing protein [Planctomycetota bacterium]|jgi:hypothetical protein
MQKLNCWDFNKCGREPGGTKSDELGICPAPTSTKLDGVHAGKNAGRACWVIAGTLCEGKEQGTFALKEANCIKCDFYKSVSQEEFTTFNTAKKLLDALDS